MSSQALICPTTTLEVMNQSPRHLGQHWSAAL